MRRALAASRVGCCESVAARRLFHLAREALAFRDMDFLTERGVCSSLSSGRLMKPIAWTVRHLIGHDGVEEDDDPDGDWRDVKPAHQAETRIAEEHVGQRMER